jgi:hypothetical protein
LHAAHIDDQVRQIDRYLARDPKTRGPFVLDPPTHGMMLHRCIQALLSHNRDAKAVASLRKGTHALGLALAHDGYYFAWDGGLQDVQDAEEAIEAESMFASGLLIRILTCCTAGFQQLQILMAMITVHSGS